MKEKSMKKEPILMTLCCRCSAQFYSTRCYRIERADKNQAVKDVCTFCGYRRGYDYNIYPKRNRIMNTGRNRQVRFA